MTEPAVEPVVGGVTTTKPASAASGTEYVVLALNSGDNSWRLGKTVKATSAEAAVRLALASIEKDGAAEGATSTMVAIPSRSWKPVKVSTKTETRLVIEEAT